MQSKINLASILEAVAFRFPDRTAVITEDKSYTYYDIDKKSNLVANMLLDKGVQPSDCVAIHSKNRIEWITIFYGIMKIRAIPIGVNFRYLKNECSYIIKDSNTKFVFCEKEYISNYNEHKNICVINIDTDLNEVLNKYTDAPPPVNRSGDDLYVIYTGGTTGLPKGVVWDHHNVIHAAMNAQRLGEPIDSIEQLVEFIEQKEGIQKIFSMSPMMHASGQWSLGNSINFANTYIMNPSTGFDPKKLLENIVKTKPTSLSVLGDGMAIPLFSFIKENSNDDLSFISVVASGAASLSDHSRSLILEVIPNVLIYDTYGSSESGAVSARFQTKGSGGLSGFNPSDSIAIFNKEMNPSGPGELGIIAKRGYTSMGYINEFSSSFNAFVDANGVRWVLTGDYGYYRDDGTISFVGREGTVINTGGEKVYPLEVEQTIISFPGVDDCIVLGVKDPRWGEMVAAVVKSNSSIRIDDITNFCKNNISSYKCPKIIKFTNESLRNDSGKVEYSLISEKYFE